RAGQPRSSPSRLLQRAGKAVFAGAEAVREGLDKVGSGLLAIAAHEGRERGKERSMGERAGLDSVVLGDVPGFRDVFKGELTLLAVVLDQGSGRRAGKWRFRRSHGERVNTRRRGHAPQMSPEG